MSKKTLNKEEMQASQDELEEAKKAIEDDKQAEEKDNEELSPEQKAHNIKMGIIFMCVAIGLFLLDLISKWIIEFNVEVGQQITLIPNFLYITKSYNTAIAFSWGSNLGVAGRIIFIAVSLLMSALIIGYWIKNNLDMDNSDRICFALLAAGAVGNLIDRAFYWGDGTLGHPSGVIDFIQFYFGGGPSASSWFLNPFATFNVADACLTIGVIMFIVLMIVESIKHPGPESDEIDPRLLEQAKLELEQEAEQEEATKEENKEETTEAKEDGGETSNP